MAFYRPQHGLAVEINPRHILVAAVGNWGRRPLEIEAVAEFEQTDIEGVRRWLRDRHEKSFVPAFCSYYPAGRVLTRETVNPRRLTEPDYLPGLLRDSFNISNPEEWQVHMLHPLTGTPLAAETATRPVLFSCLPHSATRELQQFLLDLKIMPARLELGVLPLIGALKAFNETRRDTRATVVVELEEERALVYILGKEGVHTPTPLSVGYASLVHAAMREFKLPAPPAARELLRNPTPAVHTHAVKLVRPLARQLSSVINSYELTTGQRIGEMHFSFLTGPTNWIGSALVSAMGIEKLVIDCNEWQHTVGLRSSFGVELRPEWLGLLSLLAAQPEAP